MAMNVTTGSVVGLLVAGIARGITGRDYARVPSRP
jgi:hypothetical protein